VRATEGEQGIAAAVEERREVGVLGAEAGGLRALACFEE
jgi:hypothetical protein